MFTRREYESDVYPKHDLSLISVSKEERQAPTTASCRRYKEIVSSDIIMKKVLKAEIDGENGKLVKLETIDGKTKAHVMRVYNAMVRRVSGNIRKVHAIVEELVSPQTGEFKHVDAKTLDAIVHRAKQAVCAYYLGIFYDCSIIVGTLSSSSSTKKSLKNNNKN